MSKEELEEIEREARGEIGGSGRAKSPPSPTGTASSRQMRRKWDGSTKTILEIGKDRSKRNSCKCGGVADEFEGEATRNDKKGI